MILCGSDEPGARGGFERWRDQTEVKRDGQADEGLQHTRLRLPFCPFQTESSETTNNSQSASRCINPKIPATIASTLTQPNDANDGCVQLARIAIDRRDFWVYSALLAVSQDSRDGRTLQATCGHRRGIFPNRFPRPRQHRQGGVHDKLSL